MSFTCILVSRIHYMRTRVIVVTARPQSSEIEGGAERSRRTEGPQAEDAGEPLVLHVRRAWQNLRSVWQERRIIMLRTCVRSLVP